MSGPAHSVRRLVRHRIAPIVLVAILALMAARTCQSESIETTAELRFGEVSEDIREVRGELLRPGETEAVAYFSRAFGDAGPPGPVRWELRAAPGPYELELEIQLEDAWVEIEREVELLDRGVVRVDLGDELGDELGSAQ